MLTAPPPAVEFRVEFRALKDFVKTCVLDSTKPSERSKSCKLSLVSIMHSFGNIDIVDFMFSFLASL